MIIDTDTEMVKLQNKDFFQQTAISAAIAGFISYLGAVMIPIVVLFCIMIIDYITGMISAWTNAELSSKKGIVGIVKKICYLFAVAAAMGVDWLIYSGMTQIGIQLDYTIFFGVLVTIWLIINEIISILENLSKIGVPMPKFLLAVVKRLKTTTENKFESEGDKNDG